MLRERFASRGPRLRLYLEYSCRDPCTCHSDAFHAASARYAPPVDVCPGSDYAAPENCNHNRRLLRRMSPVAPSKVPAIVVGRGQTGLGALRCLQLGGIPAYVACPEVDLVTHSRWYRPTPGAQRWDGTPGAAAEALLLAMPLPRAVLIPGADDAALWMSDLPATLRERFAVASSSRATLEILQDKSKFGEYLARTGVDHPRTYTIHEAADIERIPFDELDRVFVKPADSQRFSAALGAKGIWARDRREFLEVWKKLEDCGLSVIAQEYVPGTSADHYFVDGYRDRDGALTGLFARRRYRIFPPDFGNSSYCESIALAEVAPAVEAIGALLESLHYRGIFSAEFKRDARDGRFRLLEVNVRAWWYVEFAARCGVNVCRMAWQDALGERVDAAPQTYPIGAGCANLPGDLKAVLSRSAAERGPLWRTFAQWLRAHLHVFRVDDPKPGLVAMGEVIRLVARKALRRVRGAR